MKKLLSLFGIVTLMGANTVGLTSCQNKLTPEEISELKIKNKIKTTNEKIKANLEWMSTAEKPFEELDNKWYFVVYRKHTDSVWSIIKFNHNYFEDDKREIDKELELWIQDGDLCNKKYGITWSQWGSGKFFKAVYRWNLETDVPDLDVDAKIGEVKS